jgi:O-antigen ligase
MPRWAPRLFFGAVSLAALLIVADLWSGLALRRALGARVAYFVYNRPVLTLMALGVPVAALIRRSSWPTAATLGIVVLAIGQAESGAAVLGAAVAALVFAAIHLLSRKLAIATAALWLVAALAIAPLAGDILASTIPPVLHDRLRGTSSRARVDIARAFGSAVRQSPWVGAGFGASAGMAETDAAAAVAPELRPLLGVGHPHNAALQIWVELGAVGAALTATALLLLLRLMASLRTESLAPRLALLMGAAAVSLVGHGAWQGWWPAALGAAILWLRSTDRLNAEGPA